MEKMGDGIRKFSFFVIIPEDGAEAEEKGASVYPLEIGINRDKFRPAVDPDEIADLRRKYGFSNELPLVLHVGHLSAGRGLEEFLRLPKEKFQRLIVASGLFGNEDIEKQLIDDGVSIIKEYLADVSEVYRMADVYLFPTTSAEFVISIPLSVTEALACGTPVVAFDGVCGIDRIEAASDDALVKISDPLFLERETSAIAEKYKGNCRNLLDNMSGWDKTADMLLEKLSEK